MDILLDASASQNQQQEKLSTPGLSHRREPHPLSDPGAGDLLLLCQRLHRPADPPGLQRGGKNDAIFDYVSAALEPGRPGPAGHGLADGPQPCDHRLFILLSDANPNDDQKIPAARRYPGLQREGRSTGQWRTRPLSSAAGASLRCAFTGRDADPAAAHKIYGRDLTRIPSIGWFADTVGKLIQGRIQSMD